MNIKALALSALTASTLAFAPVPEAQAQQKNYYCGTTSNNREWCYAKSGYNSWALTVVDHNSDFHGFSAEMNCGTGRFELISNDGFKERDIKNQLRKWCLDS